MSYILRSAGFAPGGSPSWPLSQPPCWRGFAGAPAPGFSAATVWWQPGDVLALDFANSRYMREGGTASLGAVLSASRTSPATWFTDAGILQPFDANVPAITDRGLYAGGQRVNKCRNFNANPTDLTGVSKAGDAAATLTVVEDSAELAAAGLGGICTSGMAFKLDNSAGSANAQAYVTGNSGNTNPHTMSVYMRSTGSARMVLSSSGGTGWTNSAVYTQRSATVTPANSSQQLVIEAAAGKIVWFILNQLEEATFASPPIVTEGGTGTTRLADALAIPDFAALAAAFGFADGFTVKSRVYFDPAITVTQGIWAFGADSGNYVQGYIAGGGLPRFRLATSGTTRFTLTAGTWATAGWKDVECRAIDGAWQIIATDLAGASDASSFALPALSVGQIGRILSGTGFEMNGPIGEIRVGVAS